MRILILLFLIIWEVGSQNLIFEKFEKGVKNVSPFFGPLNRSALTIIFHEEAADIGIPVQKHIDVCTSRIAIYLAIRTELRSLDRDRIFKIGAAANYSNERYNEMDLDDEKQVKEEIDRYIEELIKILPVTFGLLKTQINELRTLNATFDVIRFVDNGFFKIVQRLLAQHGIFVQTSSKILTEKKSFLDQLDEAQEILRKHYRLREDDIIILNKFLCYDILNWKITIDGNVLNLQREITQQQLNLTRLLHGIEQVSPDFGPVNRTALRNIVDEEATKIGISMQEHVEVCADTVEIYLKIRDELRNLSDVEILAVDRISNELNEQAFSIHKHFDDLPYEEQTLERLHQNNEQIDVALIRVQEELNRYLPVTIGYTKMKMDVLRSINASSLVLSLVQSLHHSIIERFLSERGFNITLDGEVLGRVAFLDRMEQIFATNILRHFEKGDRALLDQYLCYGIVNRRKISSKRQYLDFKRKLIEERLNFDPIIVKLKSIHPTFESIDDSFLKEDIIKEAALLGIYDKEYLHNCTNCITGYLNIAKEHKSIGEKERNAVQQILNSTNAKLEELTPYLPVTVEFLRVKIEEMKSAGSNRTAIDFVYSAALLVVQRNLVERKMRVLSDSESVPFIILKRFVEVDEKHRALSKEDRAAMNRFFCYDFLRTKILEGIIKWT